MPNGFKGRHFPADFILLCVRWYLKFNIRYRHLADVIQESTLNVTTTARQHSFGFQFLKSSLPSPRLYASGCRKAAEPVSVLSRSSCRNEPRAPELVYLETTFAALMS
jgi:hypothetical protein